MRRLVAAALVLGFASTAMAQPESAYYGLSLGALDYQEDASQGFSAISDKTDSWRLMVGYQFMEHMAVEGALGKTGVIRDTATFVDPVIGPGTLDLGTEFQSLVIRLLGVMNFDSGLTLLGGIGWAEMNQDFDITFSPNTGILPASGDQDIGEATYFAGVQYDLDRFAVRLGYEKIDLSGADVEETSISFFYKL